MATTLADIHPDIVQTHILPRLDVPSLSATATASSHLNTLCSNDTLWSQISKTTWPSITHPFVDHLISTFPAGYRSFFNDSFPTLTTDVNNRNPRRSWSTSKPDCSSSSSSCHTSNLHEFISAVDIRYQNEVIYSKANVTRISSDDLSSAFCIELNDNISGSNSKELHDHGVSKSIGLTVDEIVGAEEAALSHLKESVTLQWILIDPTRKRACNLSSINPFTVRPNWVTNDTILRYITFLPGCDANEVVKCRIQVVLGVGVKGVGLYVKEVTLKLEGLDGLSLNGVKFGAVVAGAMAEGKRVRRRVVNDDEERWKSYMVFKEMKKERKEWEERRERRREVIVWLNHFAIFVSFFCCVYFFYLLLV